MATYKNNTVGKANYTIRDYYHDILKDNTNEELSEEEKKALNWLNLHDFCKCGDEKNEHSRFIDGLFIGCQKCNCKKFISYVE
ncbi:MAG: hypothetical protein PHU53_07695 [Thermoplasmata archaeon]|nr:hypothetical protein [Thermoplasmata archaeon]